MSLSDPQNEGLLENQLTPMILFFLPSKDPFRRTLHQDFFNIYSNHTQRDTVHFLRLALKVNLHIFQAMMLATFQGA